MAVGRARKLSEFSTLSMDRQRERLLGAAASIGQPHKPKVFIPKVYGAVFLSLYS